MTLYGRRRPAARWASRAGYVIAVIISIVLVATAFVCGVWAAWELASSVL